MVLSWEQQRCQSFETEIWCLIRHITKLYDLICACPRICHICKIKIYYMYSYWNSRWNPESRALGRWVCRRSWFFKSRVSQILPLFELRMSGNFHGLLEGCPNFAQHRRYRSCFFFSPPHGLTNSIQKLDYPTNLQQLDILTLLMLDFRSTRSMQSDGGWVCLMMAGLRSWYSFWGYKKTWSSDKNDVFIACSPPT